MRPMLLLLLSCFSCAQSEKQDSLPKIQDNSFLVEEAYNQDYGVVQHIQNFTRDFETKDYVYSFTQEWPVDVDPRHQLSYTLQAAHVNGFRGLSTGWGDILLNYRYQIVRKDDFGIAPRFSLLLPTGDSGQGRGYGGAGFQTNWAFSYKLLPKIMAHSNAGWTMVPNAKDAAGDKAHVNEFNLAQSFIWLAKPRFNVLLETVYNASQDVIAPGKCERSHDILLNPGIRWSYNLKNGTQIVPGMSVPTGVGPSAGDVGLFFYFSIEHPFTHNTKKN